MKKSIIPNLFTFANLSFGVLSLLCVFDENFILASIFIICAALVDRYDGRIARMLNVSSDLGKELDSLADLVSFGVAPAILSYVSYNNESSLFLNIIWIILLLLFPICGAYRLARYNATDFDGVFTGVPITITGTILTTIVLLNQYINIPYIVLFLLIPLLSYLMISAIKLKKI